MMVDPLEQLEQALGQIPAAKQRRHFGKALTEACDAVDPVDQWAPGLAELVPVLKACDLDDVRGEMERALDELQRIAKSLSQCATVEDFEHVRVLVARAPGECRQIAAAMERAWERRVRGEFKSIGALGRVLSKIEATHTLGESLLSLWQSAESLTRGIQNPTASVQELQTLLDQRQEVRGRFRTAGIGEQVAAFLEAIADGPVPVSHLTDEVREWLAKVEAEEAFKVSL